MDPFIRRASLLTGTNFVSSFIDKAEHELTFRITETTSTLIDLARLMRKQLRSILGHAIKTNSLSLSPYPNDDSEEKKLTINGIRPGDVLANNRYEVLETLTSGGMATISLVYDRRLQKEFVCKTLKGGKVDIDVVKRFVQEGAALAAIKHENIVAVDNLGWHDNNTPFIILEYIKGDSFKNVLQKYKTGAISDTDLKQALYDFADICKALHYLHTRQRPIIHRDLKPRNILLTEYGVIKLVDFGIAKVDVLKETLTQSALTDEGQVMGTFRYSPIADMINDNIGPHSDLYSVGIMLYEFLTGNVPFRINNPTSDADSSFKARETPNAIKNEETPVNNDENSNFAISYKEQEEIKNQHLYKDPFIDLALREEMPATLVELAKRLLNKNPEDRPRNALIVSEELCEIADRLTSKRATVPLFATQVLAG